MQWQGIHLNQILSVINYSVGSNGMTGQLCVSKQEAIVAYFSVGLSSQHLLGRTEKNHGISLVPLDTQTEYLLNTSRALYSFSYTTR